MKLNEIVYLKNGNGGGSDLTLKQDVAAITTGLDEVLAAASSVLEMAGPDSGQC